MCMNGNEYPFRLGAAGPKMSKAPASDRQAGPDPTTILSIGLASTV
jgi:hypothetical protein